MLHGEEVSAASRSQVDAGEMLAGTASTRLYENGVYRALADEARCIVAGHDGRVVELNGFVDDTIVRELGHSFRFLTVHR